MARLQPDCCLYKQATATSYSLINYFSTGYEPGYHTAAFGQYQSHLLIDSPKAVNCHIVLGIFPFIKYV